MAILRARSRGTSATDGPRIDVSAAGAREGDWRAAIEAADLPPWLPGDDPGLVLVAAPHPDDETLALGGLLHDLVRGGWRVRLVEVTDGEAAYPHVADLAAIRRRELRDSLVRLMIADAAHVHRLEIPDGSVAAHEAQVAGALTTLADDAAWVLAPWRHDGHPDHEATGRAAACAAERAGAPIRFYPVWAWHWLEPSSPEAQQLLAKAERFDISRRGRAAKRAALGAFASQRDGALGPPILPPHVVDRFTRPCEILVR